ncbi:MAG: hypothetical protein E7162_02935 [Firmicutes bacterium]|nr:hypothetical protein [Bacillota bacterium]
MQRKNIPAYVLARGVSKKGFEQLLADIKNATIEEGLNKINEYQEMIDAVKAKDENTDQWVSDFMMQLEESNRVIKENVSKIEALFETIFVDWEKYKEENGIVEEVEEETPVEETKEVVEEKVESEEKPKDDKPVEKQEEKEVVETKEESKAEVKEEEKVNEKTEEKKEDSKEEEITEEDNKKSEKKDKKSKKKKSEVAEGDKDE